MNAFGQFEKTGHKLFPVDTQLFCTVRSKGKVDTGVLYRNRGRAATSPQAVVIFHFFRYFTGVGSVV